jgi:acetoin utilization protein AcuB
MLAKNWMSRDVITIEPEDSMQLAMKLMEKHRIRALPVVHANRLVGIVSNGDIKRASASNATTLDVHELAYLVARIKVKDIMTREPVSVSPLLTVDEVAEIMLNKGISCTPVVDEDDHLIGILTKSDILKVMISLSGANRRGIDFGFNVRDEPGSIKEITDTIRSFGGRLASILISYREAEVGYRHVYVRIFHMDRNRMEELKDRLFNDYHLLYIIDYLEQSREIF